MRSRETTLSRDLEESAGSGRSTLAELYRRHAPSGRRLAYLLTGDAALAEDLVQEAFARLVGRLAHLRDKAAFDAYLRRTIVNLSKNYFRRRAVERSHLAREAAFPSGTPSEPDVVTREEMREALLALPARQRAAIVLRYYEDLPDHQIADILRCRPGTVRSLVTRGVQALRINVRGESRDD
jgi:RNA polymerase sigma-70 factor (sigma-E family)